VKTIIVAAGKGSRLWPVTQRMPKTLLPYREGTILSQILSNFGQAGVSSFTLVIGFKGEMIREYLRAHRNFGLDISLVENLEWERGNGVSVARARSALPRGESAFLSMSDHLVHPDALRALGTRQGAGSLLLTDSRIEEVFDLDDATKVRREGERILEIGKELASFNAIDCGVFRIDTGFMDALDAQIAAGRESISDGVRQLIATTGFGSVTMPPHCAWIDIDTPEAYEAATLRGDRFQGGGRPAAELAGPS
jgi:choline kinase